MSIDKLPNKLAQFGISNAKVQRILPLTQLDDFGYVEELVRSQTKAPRWDFLSSSDRVSLEGKWTDMLLSIINIGNLRIMRSVRYQLSEQSELEEEGNGTG